MTEIEDEGPVDGYSVETTDDGRVALILSNRYGQADLYTLDARDAAIIGSALLHKAAAANQKGTP